MTPPDPKRRWRIAGAVALLTALLAWGLTDIRWRARIDPAKAEAHRTDLTVYTGAAAALLDGRDPYAVMNPRGMYYLYPPLFAILLAPLTPLDSPTAAFVWFSISCALAYGCFWEVLRVCRSCVSSRPGYHGRLSGEHGGTVLIALVTVATVVLPLLNTLQRGQANLAVLYPLLLGFRLVLTGSRWFAQMLGGVALALPVALKLTPALPIAIVVLQQLAGALRSSRCAGGAYRLESVGATFLGLALGGFLCFLAIPAGIVGWQANLRLLDVWRSRVVATEDAGLANAFNSRSYRNQSLQNAAYHLGNFIGHIAAGGPDDRLAAARARIDTRMPMDHARFGIALTLARWVLLLALVGVALLTATDPAGRAAVFGLACALTLVVSPLSWAHHFVILLPAVAFAGVWAWAAGYGPFMLASGFVLALLTWVHYSALEHAGRVGLLGIGTCAWCLLGLVLLARRGIRQTAG